MPHSFPSLVEGPAQIVAICGAGLSTPNAPSVEGLKPRLDAVAGTLGIGVQQNFYKLAEEVLVKIMADRGLSDAEGRLWLAEELGILDDRAWFGEVGLPLSGNTPRHRALARFAVEQRLKAIVSLNWDALLESALDSVGLAHGSRTPRPWHLTTHACVIADDDLPSLNGGYAFPVIKPHGCVRNMEVMRRIARQHRAIPPITFKLTYSELEKLPDGQTLVDKEVEGLIAKCSLLAIGWKASEGYLRKTVVSSAKAAAAKLPAADAFTLLSRSWYPKTTGSVEIFHDEIAQAYGRNKGNSFASVENAGEPTLDGYLLWLQARYAMNRLEAVLNAADAALFRVLANQIAEPICDHPLIGWVDSWLPTWVRACWRIGVMRGADPHTNRMIEACEIPVTPRDIHVPLGGLTQHRRDLQAAAKLLLSVADVLDKFDVRRFPGGLYSLTSRKLYLPLPGWRAGAKLFDLAALQPLMQALKSLGFVHSVHLIWLDTDDAVPDAAHREQLAAQVRALMPLTGMATYSPNSWVGLEALRENVQ